MKKLKMTFLILFVLLVAGTVSVMIFLRHLKFGELPSGQRQERILLSPHYKNGTFQNEHFTPDLTEGSTYWGVMKEFFFGKSKRIAPSVPLPSQKTNLKALSNDENILVWFGHASYFIQVDGKRMLADPVLSGAASPLAFTTPSYPGTNVYAPQDLPDIDYVFISHDHWDHLDYTTMLALQPRVKKVITGLGTGAHLERWGYTTNQIIERDWYESALLDGNFNVTLTPARHFSGRSLTRNKALWVSFVLKTPSFNLYLGGDSGYDTHFAEIGQKYGPFDLALLECGQYDKSWKYIHMMPEEVVKASQDLRAERFMPVHWAKFTLGNHAWDEPILRVTAEAKKQSVPVVHPMIGEKVNLKQTQPSTAWWQGIE